MRLSLRSGLSTVLLLVAYYCLPIDRPLDGDGVALLAVGLALFAFMLTIQVRSIVRSDRPRSRAIEVLFTVLPLFLLVFATVYFAMAHTTPSSFSQPLTRTDSLYFTVTTFSTVGFGDITAMTQATRVIVTIQMLGDLAVLAAGLKVLLGAAEPETTTPPTATTKPTHSLGAAMT
ncbi:MAG: potassium channel family protein [Frankiaceae bacterium]